MPSRAFCSDESQGYPIILICKHFGTFPFNHGLVGGVVATDRHGPHAEHGKDMVIIQASHVGYDPDNAQFGVYRRLCTEHSDISSSCGKIDAVLKWYQSEYLFAQDNILIDKRGDDYFIVIDNQLLNMQREDGLFLHLEKLIEKKGSQIVTEESHSTSKCFRASDDIRALYTDLKDKQTIGKNLLPEFFYYKKEIAKDVEGHSRLEHNLFDVMPWIVASEAPLLDAAKVNTQVEFDRAFRTIVKEKGYQGKKIVYIAGLNIDISPQQDQIFPLTKFVPWAAFIKNEDGSQMIIEQDELFAILKEQSKENPDQIDMEEAILVMENVKEIKIF
ncbi:MAG: hypothetical protein OEY87_07470 [Gammaproteobacteria bacterium]|nr:hypothetical protein [Gammaproteobacteria bacterium]MDH5735946.1 hypothetical protein [Gammaproteobacteria bacterium]